MNNYAVLSALVVLSAIGLAMPAMAKHNPAVPTSIKPYVSSASAARIVASPLYFDNIDKNHDRLLSRSEIPAALSGLAAHFDQFDQDHNHRLDSGEYAQYMERLAVGNCFSSREWLLCPVSNPYSVAKTP